MSKAIFQTGMSWKIVENKWPGTRDAFRDFQPLAVAALTEADLEQLVQDKRIIRNRRKIEAIVDNARQMIDLDEHHGGFVSYLRSHDDYEALEADLRKRFRFLGEMGIFYFLYVVGEQVPPYEEWARARGRAVAHD
jgi:3-methyladenine DNA glycosylase Tag